MGGGSGISSPTNHIPGPYSMPLSALDKKGHAGHAGHGSPHKNISRNAQNRHYLAYSRANNLNMQRQSSSNNNAPSIPSNLISTQNNGIRTIQPMKGEIRKTKKKGNESQNNNNEYSE